MTHQTRQGRGKKHSIKRFIVLETQRYLTHLTLMKNIIGWATEFIEITRCKPSFSMSQHTCSVNWTRHDTSKPKNVSPNSTRCTQLLTTPYLEKISFLFNIPISSPQATISLFIFQAPNSEKQGTYGVMCLQPCPRVQRSHASLLSMLYDISFWSQC